MLLSKWFPKKQQTFGFISGECSKTNQVKTNIQMKRNAFHEELTPPASEPQFFSPKEASYLNEAMIGSEPPSFRKYGLLFFGENSVPEGWKWGGW